MSITEERALFWARIAFIGVSFIPTFTYHFVVAFLNLKRPKSLAAFYAASALFLFIIPSKFFFRGAYIYFWGLYPQAGSIYGVFITFFYAGFALCAFDLARKYMDLKRQGDQLVLRNQVKYVFLAFCVASASFSDYLPNYHIQVYPFAYLAAAGWLAIMAYGTLRYRVMDINLIFRKTLIYSTVVAVLMVLYLSVVTIVTHLFEGLTGYQTVFSSAVAAAIISFGFQPLRKRVQAFVDKKFFRQYVDREEKLYELSREVVTHTTTDEMGKALMRVIAEALHPKAGALYLRAPDRSGFVRMSEQRPSRLPERMDEENALAVYFRSHPQPFVQDMTSEIGQSYSTRLKEDREEAA